MGQGDRHTSAHGANMAVKGVVHQTCTARALGVHSTAPLAMPLSGGEMADTLIR